MLSQADSCSRNVDYRAMWILRIGACLCFAGWAWQHLRWSAPYDAVLWHPDYFGWLPGMLDVSWDAWTAEIVTDRRVLIGVRATGFVYLVLAIVALITRSRSTAQHVLLFIGSVLLAILFFCKYADAAYATATFVEHGGQILMPIVLIVALRRGIWDRWVFVAAVIGFWTTFAGHGIYALGLAPTPGQFYGLVNAVLGLDEQSTVLFLRVAGVLDFVACVGILIPTFRRISLGWAVLWGLLTAAARPVAGMSLAASWYGADLFLHEALLRTPHAAIPLFLLLVSRKRKPNE